MASRPAFVIPEVRLDRTFSQEAGAEGGSSCDEEDAEEAEDGDEGDAGEEDEDEDTSDDNYGERSEVKRSSMIETGQGAEGGLSLRVQNSLRRRTHSEGSLLQEVRGPCFASDTTLHCSDGEGTTSSWAMPSPRTSFTWILRTSGSWATCWCVCWLATLARNSPRRCRLPIRRWWLVWPPPWLTSTTEILACFLVTIGRPCFPRFHLLNLGK